MFGIFKLAKKVVNTVTRQLGVQMDMLDNLVKAPIQLMVNQVVGKTVWRGQGADAFVEVCSNLAIPSTNGISASVNNIRSSIQRAVEIMEQADADSRKAVHTLDDIFRGIG